MVIIKMESRKPTRIAYIIGKMWAGGVESCVFNYYRVIDKSRYQFDIFYDADSTVEPPADLVEMGARFYRLPPYQNLFSYLKELRKILKKEKYTIVHSHLNTLSVFPLYAAWIEGVPIRIAHNHSVPAGTEWKRNIIKKVLKRFARVFATHYFACSEKAGRWLFGDAAFNAGKVTLIRNAIDYTLFYPDEEERQIIRKELDLTGKFVVGHVGRFTYAKNHKFLISVFREILKIQENAVLILVGDGELHDEIIECLKKNEVLDKTILTGKKKNIFRYYQAMDVMILPSIFEGLPMTIIEALACNVPCILSKAIPEEALI